MHFVVNPAAAGGRLRREWPVARQRLLALGLEASFTWTERPGHATALTAALVANGTAVVVAVGGDGTVDEVVQGLRRCGRGALGILPLGTGNDGARMLGIPLQLDGAAEVLAAGSRRSIDLIAAGDRVVLNAIGVGLLGAISANAASIKLVRGMAAYLVAGVGTLFRYRCPVITLSGGTSPYNGEMTILAIQNGATSGGGIPLCPGARPADGELDVTLVTGTGVPARLSAIGACLRGTLGHRSFTRQIRAPRIDLLCDQRLPCHWDGNVGHIDPPGLRFEVLPLALEVIAPDPPASAS